MKLAATAPGPAETGALACGGYGHRLFDTALGRCGIAWAPGGIQAVQLPEASDEATLARLLRSAPPQCADGSQPMPAVVRAAMDAIQALLAGEPRDLREVALDLSRLSPFQQRVYDITRGIPPGTTMEYADVARALGEPGAARAVGRALGMNPFAPVVPCHRVLARGGQPGGFSAEGGTAIKLRMLAIEGALGHAGLPLFGDPAHS